MTGAPAGSDPVVAELPGGVGEDVQGSSSTWSLSDLRSDVLVVTNGAGRVTGSLQVYDPFGNPVDSATGRILTTTANTSLASTTSMPHTTGGFAGGVGKLTDTLGDIDLTQMGAREYSPELGRFLQQDPVPGGNANAYNYPNDPINANDFTGLTIHPWVPGLIGLAETLEEISAVIMRDGRSAIQAAESRLGDIEREKTGNMKEGQNWGNDKDILPEREANGETLKYKEWDIQPGKPRLPYRLVTGSDGSGWLTVDHYETFINLRPGKGALGYTLTAGRRWFTLGPGDLSGIDLNSLDDTWIDIDNVEAGFLQDSLMKEESAVEDEDIP